MCNSTGCAQATVHMNTACMWQPSCHSYVELTVYTFSNTAECLFVNWRGRECSQNLGKTVEATWQCCSKETVNQIVLVVVCSHVVVLFQVCVEGHGSMFFGS